MAVGGRCGRGGAAAGVVSGRRAGVAGASPADPDLAAFDVKCGRVGRERCVWGLTSIQMSLLDGSLGSRTLLCCCFCPYSPLLQVLLGIIR